MNEMHVVTRPTDDPLVFDTYWMTGLMQKGRVRSTVFMEDDIKIGAELAAVQFLLEQKNVCGHNKAGAGLRLWVSCDEISALLKEDSERSYLSAYANYLRTRFLGAEVIVDNESHDWVDLLCEAQVDDLSVYGPAMTVIDVAGVGPVELTAHAVERYIQRFERPAVKAWRDLVKLAKEAIHVNPPRKAIHDVKHRNRGFFFLARQVMLVVAEPDHPGQLPRLVTVSTPDMSVV